MYAGHKATIPLGDIGIISDQSQNKVSYQALIEAENVSLKYGVIERDPGSKKWSTLQLSAGIAGFFDWWPNAETQRLIVACKDGKVYRFTSQYANSEITNAASAVLNFAPSTTLVPGGIELTGRDRKLFILSGNDIPQVISADGTTRSDLSRPALDWGVGNWPTTGVIHAGSLWVWGCKNNPHTLYRSNVSDHEDFQTIGAAQFYNLFPGEFDRVLCGFTFKGRLHLIKYPYGLYYVDESTGGMYKLSTSFGAASEHSAIQVLDDMLIANSSGSITSLKAVFALGNMEQGDVLKIAGAQKYGQQNLNQLGTFDRQAVYYEAKKMAYFTYRAPSSTTQNKILALDFDTNNTPKVSLISKDQPNCIGLWRDGQNVGRPIYGCDDGYLYQMDQMDRNVGGSAYKSTFQTPHLDFGWLSVVLKEDVTELDKIFDFIEITFEPMGFWNLSCDVFIDGKFIETRTFKMARSPYLDVNFFLDKSRMGGLEQYPAIQPVHGMGKRLSLRFYTSGLNQNFKVSAATVYFRVAGQQQRSS